MEKKQTYVFIFFEQILKSGDAGSNGKDVFTFIRNHQHVFLKWLI